MKRTLPYLALAVFMLLSVYAGAQDIGQLGQQKPFTINGTLGMGIGTYNSSGIQARERNFSYIFNGAPTISIYGISFPFSVVVSDQQRGFRQPFNQYGISPTYKWITLHAGWQNVQFSQFTLAGYNILGGGVELNPGKLRMGFIYGRFNKAIEENATEPLSFQTPAYKRTGFSAKLGWGTERNHVDVIMLNAKDDPNSLKKQPVGSFLTPSENLVLGIASKFTFFDHFDFDVDMAGSIYTRNIKDDTLKNLQLDKFEFIKKLVTINASTQLLTAGQASLNYHNSIYRVGVQYRRVDPDYKSMGAYYFETDVANYTVQGALALLKSKMQVTGSLGFQNDNLMHDKSYTSKRNISSLGVSYNTAKYGADVRYSNYGITQDRGLNPIIDTFRVARTNYNVNGMLRYTFGDQQLSHSLVLVANVQSLVDLNRFTSAQNQTKSKTGNFSYQLGLGKAGVSLSSNFNYTVADFSTIHSVFFGPSIGIGKQLDQGKLGLNAAVSYQQQQNNYKNAGSIFNTNINGSYRFTKRDGANINLSYLKSNSKDITLPSFNEVRTSLNLTHSF